MCGGDAIVCNFEQLKKRREIKINKNKKKLNIKRWSEYVIKRIDMNLCICKNKKKLLFNNVCIRFNDL